MKLIETVIETTQIQIINYNTCTMHICVKSIIKTLYKNSPFKRCKLFERKIIIKIKISIVSLFPVSMR